MWENCFRKMLVSLLAAFLILTFYGNIVVLVQGANPSEWWDFDWRYRIPIRIEEKSGNNLTDYQVCITIDTASLISAGKMQANCSDIRFVDSANNELPYWIESGVNTNSTKVWVKVPSIPLNGTTLIYMYYGNPDATSHSDLGIFPFSLVKTIDLSGVISYDKIYRLAFAQTEEKRNLLLVGIGNDIYADQNMPVYDVEEDRVIGNVIGYRPKGVAWSGRASMIAVGCGGSDSYVRIFETTNWTQIYTIPYPGFTYYDAFPAFKGDDYLIVSYEYNHKLRVYNCSNWSLLKEMDVGYDSPKFNPAYTEMAIVTRKRSSNFSIIDTSDKNPANWFIEKTIDVHNGTVYRLAWSPDGRRLIAITGTPYKMYLYDTSTWTIDNSRKLPGTFQDIAYGIGVVVAYWNVCQALVYDPNTLSLVKTIGPANAEFGGGVAFNLHRNYLAVGWGKVVYLYKVREFTSPEPTYKLGSEESFMDFSIPWEEKTYHVAVMSNSTVEDFNFSQPEMQIRFNVSGLSGTVGYCNVSIPKSLLRGEPWTVKINGTDWSFISSENATHSFIYFTYTHASTLQVIIQGTWVIPEFSSTMILLFLMSLTLLAIALTKKTRKIT